MSRNLWPEDLVASQFRSPVVILKEQAAFLERHTNNIVSALVKNVEDSATKNPFVSSSLAISAASSLEISGTASLLRSQAQINNTRLFAYDFYITAPALGNYRYLLFRISHGFDDVYPTTIFVDGDLRQELQVESDRLVANSEQEFEECLAEIFKTAKTKKVISVLFSQVQSA
ncbi:hypothetical protein [Leptolyngbya sp. PCC 6406]|uniref:hypothetical protein n=1 Tax=Leptolyngbya sp. PCC 6406 TaxID=1173264 RepID=UPI0002ABDE1A|nr:hypothetical protein [Leptolyngbya sp. PCC 6406]